MTEEKGEGINFRRWISRVIALMIILACMTYMIQQYLGVPLILDIMITVIAILMLFFLHEYLHFLVALKLGYKPEWYRTRFMMGFEIDTKDRKPEVIEKEKSLSQREKKERHLKDNKSIAVAPYFVCVPLSIAFIFMGYQFSILGVTVAGILSLIGHGITLPMEAKLV